MTDRIAYSVTDAAALIGISKSKMYELVKREDCDFCTVIGGRRLVSRARLEAWLERQIDKAG